MLLSRVVVSPDVLHACLSHALSTEHQEIMGLLLGSLVKNNTEAFIERSMVLSRKDKKKDRVEVSYADLGLASTVAEDLSLRVVGWYHSHPHITVLPSHVDVKTQGQYQALGDFLGLIFSVFDKGRLEMCAFQSRQNRSGDWERVEIPIIVGLVSRVPANALQSERRLMESLIAMQLVLLNEDKETFEISSSHHIRGCSYLNISRTLSVYQSSLLRLLDVQICPLLMALKSKVLSLENERETLLRELASFSEDDKCEMISNEDADIEVVGLSAPQSIRTESDKALKALETTIPKWTRSSSALKTAFAGMTVEVVSVEHEDGMSDASSSFRRGDRYVLRTKRSDTSPFSKVISPWDLEFESEETEMEEESKRSSPKYPLLAVHSAHNANMVEFTIVQHMKPSTTRLSGGKSDVALCRVMVTVRILSANGSVVDASHAKSIGDYLHSSLRLNLYNALQRD